LGKKVIIKQKGKNISRWAVLYLAVIDGVCTKRRRKKKRGGEETRVGGKEKVKKGKEGARNIKNTEEWEGSPTKTRREGGEGGVNH